ncbi:hypothetical protein B997_01408 [Brucella melitensis UK3/06]|nr:hypothetical protein B997_01408 [Brucella melitensis UK3/06]
MTEYTAARFVQHKIAQGFVIGDEARLFPYGFTGWRGDTADDDIANFSLRMTADNMNDLGAAHDASCNSCK